MAGVSSFDKPNVELTFDAIADFFEGEDDPRKIFYHENTPDGKSSVFMISKFWARLHRGDRMRWRELASSICRWAYDVEINTTLKLIFRRWLRLR
jgi:hypothetical protein